MVMLAPPGTIERRYGLALALKALAPGAPFTILAPKDRGGSRLRAELAGFGCSVEETAKRHHRICTGTRPALAVGIEAAIADGAPRVLADLGLWSQPGIFSWDRIDPGSDLLVRTLPALRGRGADLGCGLGALARAVLTSAKVEHLTLIDIDRRAVALARLNVSDPRAETRWADLRHAGTGLKDTGLKDLGLKDLDFVVMNPPFHDAGSEDRGLGQIFIRRAAESLHPGGTCWLTANRHLPYEGVLRSLFRAVTLKDEAAGYKIYEARK
jgi:16S rRNA (guanine1207-N2)-methyltransferase